MGGTILYNEFCDDLSRCYLTEVGVVSKGMESTDDYTRLTNMLRQEKTKIRKVFRRVDKDGDGSLTIEEWLDLLDFYQLDIHEHEARVLHSRFDADQSGKINYNEFCDQITHASSEWALSKTRRNTRIRNLMWRTSSVSSSRTSSMICGKTS